MMNWGYWLSHPIANGSCTKVLTYLNIMLIFLLPRPAIICIFVKISQFLKKKRAMFQIGNILKTIREERSFQLLDVQERTGIDLSQLSRIENGKRLPTVDQLGRLSTLYGIDNKIMLVQRESDKIVTSFEDLNIGLESLDVAKDKLILGQKYLNMFRSLYLSEPIALSRPLHR